MAGPDIVELTTEAQLRDAYPIMDQLRPVGEDRFVELVGTMSAESGYRLFALRVDGDVRGLAGVVVETNLYHGTHAWVHDLVVDEPHRGRGHGDALLSWVESWAENRGCSCVELASGLWREEAHGFYEDRGMERYCYTFKTDLPADSPY
ncbi:GNAT family N-acetyltransferase [Natronomonas sp.]|uniref:GNAT family N-acetyltransferase n=1 Tax=Natronomonas sp. TaxID=2184060 RepID=UPI00260F3CE5|nr:GNAT family N-acetyltransferase [Natronomonas sp.]